jgi:hypothetical protein
MRLKWEFRLSSHPPLGIGKKMINQKILLEYNKPILNIRNDKGTHDCSEEELKVWKRIKMNIEDKFRLKVLLKSKTDEELSNLLLNVSLLLDVVKEILYERWKIRHA